MADKKDQQDLWRAVGIASGAGFTMLSCIGLGLYIGYQLDETMAYAFPWGVFIGGIVGGAIGFYALYEQIVNK